MSDREGVRVWALMAEGRIVDTTGNEKTAERWRGDGAEVIECGPLSLGATAAPRTPYPYSVLSRLQGKLRTDDGKHVYFCERCACDCTVGEPRGPAIQHCDGPTLCYPCDQLRYAEAAAPAAPGATPPERRVSDERVAELCADTDSIPADRLTLECLLALDLRDARAGAPGAADARLRAMEQYVTAYTKLEVAKSADDDMSPRVRKAYTARDEAHAALLAAEWATWPVIARDAAHRVMGSAPVASAGTTVPSRATHDGQIIVDTDALVQSPEFQQQARDAGKLVERQHVADASEGATEGGQSAPPAAHGAPLAPPASTEPVAPAPCPWCGTNGDAEKEPGEPAHWIACNECHANGPIVSSKKKAIAAWNRVSARPDREVMDLLRECQAVVTDVPLLARLARALGEGR